MIKMKLWKITIEKWAHFLDPDVLKPNLILATIYIAAFEILNNSIIERIKDCYETEFNGKEWVISSEYKNEILLKNKSPVYASLIWLKEMGAIVEDDIKNYSEIKDFRNLLAHEISKLMMEGLPPKYADRYNDIITLLDKIETWWIVNYEIPNNPDICEKLEQIDESKIVPGPIVGLKILIDVALGPDDIAKKYIQEYKEKYIFDS